MNAWVKGALIFTVGALSGAGGMYLVLDKKYEKLLNDEVEDIREHYRTIIVNNFNGASETASTEEPESSKATHISKDEYDVVVKDGAAGAIDYTSFAHHDDIPTAKGAGKDHIASIKDELDKVSRTVHDDDFDEHMSDRESPEDEEDDEYLEALHESQRIADEQEQAKNEEVEPYPISRSEYFNQKAWYEKLSWNFYQDGFVTDEQDEKVEAPELFLGPNLLEAFEIDEDDPDVAYIRDDQRARDIEVSRLEEEYYPKMHPDSKANVVNGLKLSSEE